MRRCRHGEEPRSERDKPKAASLAEEGSRGVTRCRGSSAVSVFARVMAASLSLSMYAVEGSCVNACTDED